ncbi:MAG: hypothetical protein K2K37_13265 [Muribaculaceae bacterium]|nr:hypothetical protein [Muribaculaceae bacterium]
MEDKDNTEIRSEKVNRLLGNIPPDLIRWGNVIIVTILLGLLLVVCTMPYPHSSGESILQHLINDMSGSPLQIRDG